MTLRDLLGAWGPTAPQPVRRKAHRLTTRFRRPMTGPANSWLEHCMAHEVGHLVENQVAGPVWRQCTGTWRSMIRVSGL